jgi:peptide-methionine (S)-S-oxide reductase
MRLAEASKEGAAEALRSADRHRDRRRREFWPAEEYHQRYHEKNPIRYKYYRWNCGRDQRLEEVWGKDAPPKMAKP